MILNIHIKHDITYNIMIYEKMRGMKHLQEITLHKDLY